MHVILTILKILGILLLVILGLLLAIVLSVLFVPVRYQLEGEKPSPGWSEANGKIRVSWLAAWRWSNGFSAGSRTE